jgi:hypothetical protein
MAQALEDVAKPAVAPRRVPRCLYSMLGTQPVVLSAYNVRLIAKSSFAGFLRIYAAIDTSFRRAAGQPQSQRANSVDGQAEPLQCPARQRRSGQLALIRELQAHRAAALLVIREIQAAGVASMHGIAQELNRRGVPAARGGRWYDSSVRAVLARASMPEPPEQSPAAIPQQTYRPAVPTPAPAAPVRPHNAYRPPNGR